MHGHEEYLYLYLQLTDVAYRHVSIGVEKQTQMMVVHQNILSIVVPTKDKLANGNVRLHLAIPDICQTVKLIDEPSYLYNCIAFKVLSFLLTHHSFVESHAFQRIFLAIVVRSSYLFWPFFLLSAK